MRSPTLAIAWEFRRRHQWPLIAMAGYLVALAALKLLLHGPMDPITLVPPDGRGAVLIAPLSTTYFYYLAVFSFGFSGDLAARQSIYPARMFALPVPTRTLVLAPMLYGTGTVAILCLASSLLARWPWGINAPLISPALLGAAFLAWTQALMWMPYGLPQMRAIVTVLWLVTLDTVVLLAIHFKASEPVMIAILAPQLPLAYLTARYALARARRGDVPDWSPVFARLLRGAESRRRGQRAFASAARAQLWFEWRRHGRSLPTLVGILLPFEMALLWLANDAPVLVLEILLLALFTPLLTAAFAATTVSTANLHARDAYGVSPFIGMRPLTTAGLVAAKLKMAAWSAIAAWLLVLIAIPFALQLSGVWPMVDERARWVIQAVGLPRAIVFTMLVGAGLMTSTWRQLVQGLCIGLTGRAWIIRSSVIVALAVIVFIGPVAQWIDEHERAQAALWVALPWILVALVSLKMLAADWVAALLAGSGLLSDRTLVSGAAIWVASVFALYGVLSWLVSGPLIPQYILVLFAILAVPLARVSAAPLALAWNRHR